MKKNRVSRESPAVECARAARRALAKDCNYDVDKLGRVLIERQHQSKQEFVIPAKKSVRL